MPLKRFKNWLFAKMPLSLRFISATESCPFRNSQCTMNPKQTEQNRSLDDVLKHECGVAMLRLRKPIDYYYKKYGTHLYGLNKLYLMMEKQHNRGQEGAGIACVKLDAEQGKEFMFRERSEANDAISEIFAAAHKRIATHQKGDRAKSADVPFIGQQYMGHLRYSTTGKLGIGFVHPFLRRSNYRAQNLALCGNFNLTNVQEVFDYISNRGQHPRQFADTYILLEQLGHRLDREADRLYAQYEAEGLTGRNITEKIEENIDLSRILQESAHMWDGGFVICGMNGSGESFAMRDPWGIRPAFYYYDEEVMVLASERPVIQTALNVEKGEVKELMPGEAIFVRRNNSIYTKQILEAKNVQPCSFERIYFSRGSDSDIYTERKRLGANLVPQILKSIDNDLKNTVFSFIPNTAEVAFFGLQQGLNGYLNSVKSKILSERMGQLTQGEIEEVLSFSVRSEKVALKDIKLRTFITQGSIRNDMAAHVYDITYGSVAADRDKLVVIDDSIVRGTTLRQSIIKILARLNPVKIVIVSSAPQIRYPDFYGIDMSNLTDFIAFRAAIALLEDNGQFQLIKDVYHKCKAQMEEPAAQVVNHVKEIYAPFTDGQISAKIAQLLTPEEVKVPVEIIFQSIEGLHDACPNHKGDWYFSGDYPTIGGNRLVNKAFVAYIENQG